MAKLLCISRSFTENTHGTSESGNICTKSSDAIGGSGFSSGGNPNVFHGMVGTLIEIFPTPIGLLDIGRTFSWLRLSTLLLTILARLRRQQQQVKRCDQQRSSAVSHDSNVTVRSGDVRRIQRSSDSSAGHAEGSAPPAPVHIRRRQLELSGSQQ
ncbi:hypothetical protein DL764_001109 [Monosporascus ibericus]|uniref:Uncharacterized protein n=1 Tax=Monosporascus ibericus TaxID=155417 RepID=A0A4Q4TVT4_9PEZI|nr:hypothetical protein DL764_001109 [Monosporascus ibericus]